MARAVANGKIGDFAAAVVGIRLRTDAIGEKRDVASPSNLAGMRG
jgi:hypothetical protein